MTTVPHRTARVRDQATAEEIAAVLAALDAVIDAARPPAAADRSGYEGWRRTRLNALRARSG